MDVNLYKGIAMWQTQKNRNGELLEEKYRITKNRWVQKWTRYLYEPTNNEA